MGDTKFSQNGLLTEERKAEISFLAKKYYTSSIKGATFSQDGRKMGTEHEGPIIYADGSLTPNIVTDILKHKPESMQITKELGMHQIEHIVGPIEQGPRYIDELLLRAQHQRQLIQEYARAHDAAFVPIGLVPTIARKDLGEHLITNDPRYLIAAAESKKAGVRCTISTTDGRIATLEDITAITLINSTRIHLQALDANDAVRLFNYSQMIAPIILALSANSSIFDQQKTAFVSQQMPIFEQSVPLCNGRKRCQLHPGYITSTDDYFEHALQYLPIFDPGDGNGVSVEEKAFHLTVGFYHPWVKLRTENGHYRMELRSVNVQPTTKEDIALAQLYVLGVQALMDYNYKLLPFEHVRENFERATMHGIDALLHWDASYGAVREYPTRIVAHKLICLASKWGRQHSLLSAQGEELIELLDARVEQGLTPGKKLARKTDECCFEHAFFTYKKHAMMDTPYIAHR